MQDSPVESLQPRRLDVGSSIDHPAFGHGQVVGYENDAYVVVFDSGERRRILFSFIDSKIAAPEVAEASPAAAAGSSSTDIRRVVRSVLEELGLLEGAAEIGKRWHGGTLRLIPGDTATQSKDVPLEAFFRKIIGVRDKLRVLEQKINASAGLSQEEKIELQGYITKSYGSLTTFNVLFSSKDAQFKGTGGGD